MKWKSQYGIGITEVDKQNKRLFEFVENLKINMQKHTKAKMDSSNLVKEGFTEIIQYTHEHFECEEKLMKMLHYPGIEFQKKQHHELVTEIKELLLEMKTGRRYNVIQLYNFLNQWLSAHIINEDQKLKEFVDKRRLDNPNIKLNDPNIK